MRLLLAEDEKSLARAIGTILEKNHYSIDLVYNGRDALDYLMSDTYDGRHYRYYDAGNGRDHCAEKTAEPGDLHTGASAYGKIRALRIRCNGLDSGANDYLTKPFATQELLARIRAMTRTNTAQSSSRMHMGNITLDRATFEISTPFGSFRLANREFQMMRHLYPIPAM